MVPDLSRDSAINRVHSLRGYYADVIDAMIIDDFCKLADQLRLMSNDECESILREIEHDTTIEP